MTLLWLTYAFSCSDNHNGPEAAAGVAALLWIALLIDAALIAEAIFFGVYSLIWG